MRNFLINSALALAMGVTGMPLFAAPSLAQDTLELQIGPGGARVRTRDRCNPDFEDCYRRDRYERDRYDDDDFDEERTVVYRRRGCSEDRALDKAERMGIRRARVVSAGRRTIEVRGRARGGDRVSVVFGRERGCPVYN